MSSPPAPDASICVAVYREHDPPNLASLAASLQVAVGRYSSELVVALNGLDAEAAGVPEGATVVDLGINRGVSIGWNRAADRARGRHLIFANDDLVLGPASLERLLDALEAEPDAGVVGPVGTQWDIERGRHIAYLPSVDAPAGSVRECDVVSGFLFATPADVFRRIGGFDEALTPCSFEEVDYCTAVRVGQNLRCLEVAGVDFRHDFGISAASRWQRVRFNGTSERIGRIARRNRRHFVRKWAGRVRHAGAPGG